MKFWLSEHANPDRFARIVNRLAARESHRADAVVSRKATPHNHREMFADFSSESDTDSDEEEEREKDAHYHRQHKRSHGPTRSNLVIRFS